MVSLCPFIRSYTMLNFKMFSAQMLLTVLQVLTYEQQRTPGHAVSSQKFDLQLWQGQIAVLHFIEADRLLC